MFISLILHSGLVLPFVVCISFLCPMLFLYSSRCLYYIFFFFQAEDGIRDLIVTGVQTCALPICNVRDFLQTEGERVQREIASYAQLSQVAMTSVKIIAESMSQWKSQVSDARLDQIGRASCRERV